MTTQVTTGVIADASVTSAKLASGAAAANLGSYVSSVDGRTGAVAVFVADTAKNSTSGTNVDFTGIPSWAKRVMVAFNGVSTNGSSNLLIQLGTSGGIVSTGYNSTSANLGSGTTTAFSTAGFIMTVSTGASDTLSGLATICLVGSNNWVANGLFKQSTSFGCWGAGDCALGGQLTQLRITSVGGTNSFDAGSINIMYD